MLAVKELLYDTTTDAYVAERIHACPPDVDLATVQSYVEQRLGEVRSTSSTSTEELADVAIGWVFDVPADWPVVGDPRRYELVAIPMLLDEAGDVINSAFLAQAAEKERMRKWAADAGIPFTVDTVPPRDYPRATE